MSQTHSDPASVRLTRRQLVGIAGAALASAGLATLTACGAPAPSPTAKPAAPAPTSAPAAQPTAAPAATKAAEPAKPTTAPAAQPTTAPAAKPATPVKPPVVLQGVDPETLDPHYGESGVGMTVLDNTLETLVNYNRKMKIVPVLAESYQVLDDKVTWRFKLRQNVKFHNGEPFNAEAVKFTVERTLNADLRAKGLNDPFPLRSGIDKIKVVDPYTVEMVLKTPNIVLPVFLTFLYMLEPKYYGSKPVAETSLRPMGTGPYRVTDWVKGDRLVLQRFSGYWRGDPAIAEFQYKPVPERATRLNMLLTGEADAVGGLTPEDFPPIQGNNKLRISQCPGNRRVHIGIPVNVPRYQNRAARQALMQAIDYDGIAKALLGPMAPAQRRSNVLVSGDTWLNPELKPVAYSADAAKKGLQAAGYPVGEKVNVICPTGRYLKGDEIAQAVAGNLRAIGIAADAQLLDWNVYSDKMRAEKGGMDDLYVLGLGSRFNGPEDTSIVTTGQIWDQTQWIKNTENGPKFEAMYKELTQTFDEKKQHDMVNEMQRLFMEEAVWASIWLEPAATGINKRLSYEVFPYRNLFHPWPYGEDPVKITG